MMRLTIVTLLVGVWGCVPNRTDGLTCEQQSDCDVGRVCRQGTCVVNGEPDAGPEPVMVDATPEPDAAPACAAFHNHLFSGCDLPATPGPARSWR